MGFLQTLFGSSPTEEQPPEEVVVTPPRALTGPTESVPEPVSRPIERADGPPDFQAVLQEAGVTPDQRLRVHKAQELLRSLPSGTTPALKRQIVEAAFKAFDIPTQDIIRDASAHVSAMNAYVAAGERMKQEALEQGNARVKDLEGQIAAVRGQIAAAVAAQDAREVATRTEIGRVEPVLAFFLSETVVPDDLVLGPTGEEEHPTTTFLASELSRVSGRSEPPANPVTPETPVRARTRGRAPAPVVVPDDVDVVRTRARTPAPVMARDEAEGDVVAMELEPDPVTAHDEDQKPRAGTPAGSPELVAQGSSQPMSEEG